LFRPSFFFFATTTEIMPASPASVGGRSASTGRLPAWAPYHFYSDNSMNDRVARLQPPPKSGGQRPAGLQPEKSGRTVGAGWDKYYFFSVPADNSVVSKTARLGRGRPSASGPQTFCTAAFTAEDIAKEKARRAIEGGMQKTAYSEFFSQLERSSTARAYGQVDGSAVLKRAASESLIKSPAASGPACPVFLPPDDPDYSTGGTCKQTQPPAWAKSRNEGLLTKREHLFPEGHQTFVDLYAKDRPAPTCCSYTLFVG